MVHILKLEVITISKRSRSEIGIFAILNSVNRKVYIGAGDLYSRKATNWSLLRAGKHYNAYLQSEWDHYGEQNFDFITLFECKTPEDHILLPKYEALWIKLTMASSSPFGYNLYKKNDQMQDFVLRIESFNRAN